MKRLWLLRYNVATPRSCDEHTILDVEQFDLAGGRLNGMMDAATPDRLPQTKAPAARLGFCIRT
jgi:hypothetical protein